MPETLRWREGGTASYTTGTPAQAKSVGRGACPSCTGSLARLAKGGRNDEELRRLGAAGGRLYMTHPAKTAPQAVQELFFAASLPDLCDEATAGQQDAFSKVQGCLRQRHDPQMIGLPMTGSLWRHI